MPTNSVERATPSGVNISASSATERRSLRSRIHEVLFTALIFGVWLTWLLFLGDCLRYVFTGHFSEFW